jgi:hypothetical protein
MRPIRPGHAATGPRLPAARAWCHPAGLGSRPGLLSDLDICNDAWPGTSPGREQES